MKSEYKKRLERKRLSRAVQERFPEPERTLTDQLPKKIVRINCKTIVLAPEEASILQIRSRYE
ncbi:MAG: hypothetical protein ACWA6U_07865 [Breznakibacter sp.]